MILVALGLALYEGAFQAGPGTRMAALPLTAPMERLRPGPDAVECRRQLRVVRPLGDHMLGGRLRLTDLARLEACTEQEWDRWCEATFRVLSVHLKARRRAQSTRASTPDRPRARPLHRRGHLPLVQRASPGPLASGARAAAAAYCGGGKTTDPPSTSDGTGHLRVDPRWWAISYGSDSLRLRTGFSRSSQYGSTPAGVAGPSRQASACLLDSGVASMPSLASRSNIASRLFRRRYRSLSARCWNSSSRWGPKAAGGDGEGHPRSREVGSWPASCSTAAGSRGGRSLVRRSRTAMPRTALWRRCARP
ncbi:hypothetical protein QF037_000100 [Streptomyces canus]|nr:hypothetical protein [Streptomyces canus]